MRCNPWRMAVAAIGPSAALLGPAAAAGFPLVPAGHTHGGQIMLTDHIGAGPIRFRYRSGLYRKVESQLFISTAWATGSSSA